MRGKIGRIAIGTRRREPDEFGLFVAGALDADVVIFGRRRANEFVLQRVRNQCSRHTNGAAGIEHMDDRACISRRNPQRGMDARRRRPADKQRHRHAHPLHFGRHGDHFIERRRDQPRQANHVGAFVVRRFQDGHPRHHHAKIDDFEIVALEDDADDVLADIVHIALHRRHDDLALRRRGAGRARQLFRFDERQQVRHRFLHHPRRFDDLRQEHLAGAEQVADHVHAVHQRPFDDIDRPAAGVEGLQPRFLGIVNNERVEPFDQRVFQPFVDRQLAPSLGGLFDNTAVAAEAFGNVEQAIRGIGPAVEHDIFARLPQFGIDRVIHIKLPGVDDRHVEPGRDGMIQEDRMHRAAHRFITAE